MASHTFDGVVLKQGSRTIGNVKGAQIREASGSHVVGNIRGDDIREGSGSHVLFNVRGDDIRAGSGSSRIARMRDVDSAIEGPGGMTKAALWLLFIR